MHFDKITFVQQRINWISSIHRLKLKIKMFRFNLDASSISIYCYLLQIHRQRKFGGR